jgi:hypothetical protein
MCVCVGVGVEGSDSDSDDRGASKRTEEEYDDGLTLSTTRRQKVKGSTERGKKWVGDGAKTRGQAQRRWKREDEGDGERERMWML